MPDEEVPRPKRKRTTPASASSLVAATIEARGASDAHRALAPISLSAPPAPDRPALYIEPRADREARRAGHRQYTDGQIIALLQLKQAGIPQVKICRDYEVSAAMLHQWELKFGGAMAAAQARADHMAPSTVTEARRAAYIECIREGMYSSDAALCTGVAEAEFIALKASDPLFNSECLIAEGEAIRDAVRMIKTGNKQWTAAGWYLDRRYPKKWAPAKDRVEEPDDELQRAEVIKRTVQWRSKEVKVTTQQSLTVTEETTRPVESRESEAIDIEAREVMSKVQ